MTIEAHLTARRSSCRGGAGAQCVALQDQECSCPRRTGVSVAPGLLTLACNSMQSHPIPRGALDPLQILRRFGPVWPARRDHHHTGDMGLARAAGLCCRHAVAHAPPGRGPEPTLIGQNCYPAGFPLTKQRRTAAEHGTWTFRARPRTSILPDARHPALHMAMPRAIQHHTFPKYTLNDTISPLETSLEWTNVYCTSFNPAAARLPDPIPPRRVSRRETEKERD